MPNGIRGGNHRQRIINLQCLVNVRPAVLRTIFKALGRRSRLYGLIPDRHYAAASVLPPEHIQFIADSGVNKANDHAVSLQGKRRILYLDVAHGIETLRIKRPLLHLHQSVQIGNG